MIKIEGVIGSWEVDPTEVVSQINQQVGDFEISLDSVGGSVIGGISIANAMRDYDKGKITVTVNAVSASIASYFMMYADTVKVHDNTTVMIHNAWLPVVGDFKALRKAADISEGFSSIMAKAYVSKASKSEEDIKNLMDEETYYYGADIVKNGFADEVITTESKTTEAEAKAFTISSLEACNKAVMQNEKVSFEAVAKLIPVEENLEDLEHKQRLANINAKQKRDRMLSILKQGKEK